MGAAVRQWALEGRRIDRGRWKRVRNGTLEYYPRVDVAGGLNENSGHSDTS